MSASKRRVLRWDPYEEPGEGCVEFRLTYEGLLLGSGNKNNRPAHKHDIRKAFHPQLKRLWEEHHFLNRLATKEQRQLSGETYLNSLANQYGMFGYRFAPLVRKRDSLLCALDILVLRPGARGGIVNAGDIDNRLKTLFDALRTPENASELGGAAPAEGEDPFFCLLENDNLITHIAVETDRLLAPVGDSENDNNVRLVITVKIEPYAGNIFNSGFR
ncbi:MAG: hypothetical protein ABL864_02485 [Terricaulis sp.]